MAEKSRLRRALSRWADSEDQHNRALREEHSKGGARSVATAPDRERVRVQGVVRTVTLRPRGGVPALEADLDDGTGVLTLVWLGRRRIAGVEPGRSLAAEGIIGVHGGVRIIFNPRYELRP